MLLLFTICYFLEPNSFKHVFNREISGTQLAEDYKTLRKILNEGGYKSSSIFGPEANHIGDRIHNGVKYAEEFLENSGNSVDFLTWHQYYLNGREAIVEDFINVTVFNFLPEEINTFDKMLKNSNKSIPTCLCKYNILYIKYNIYKKVNLIIVYFSRNKYSLWRRCTRFVQQVCCWIFVAR